MSNVSGVHIAFVGPFPPDKGGISQHGARLVAVLRQNHEVTVIRWRSMYPRLLYPGSHRDQGVEPVGEAVLRWWSPVSWYRAGRRARGSDLVVVPWVHPFQALALGTLMRIAKGAPIVVIAHNVLPHERFPMQKTLTRWALRVASRAVAHSMYVAHELQDLVAGLPVDVAPHPPNLPLRPEAPPAPGSLKLLFLGYVRSYKGLDLAIEAVRLLSDRGLEIELTAAGEFWDPLESYESLVQSLDVGERVRLEAGYVPDERLVQLLIEHHLVVAPYRSATQSGIVPLAFAAGRPVVATPVGGLVEQIRHGHNGVIAMSVDARALADAIGRAAEDYDSLQQGAAVSAPTWEQVAGAVVP